MLPLAVQRLNSFTHQHIRKSVTSQNEYVLVTGATSLLRNYAKQRN